MEFSRQEYWSGLLFPSPGHLPNPGIEPASLVSSALQAGSLPPCHLGVQVSQSIRPKTLKCVFFSQHLVERIDWLLLPASLFVQYLSETFCRLRMLCKKSIVL